MPHPNWWEEGGDVPSLKEIKDLPSELIFEGLEHIEPQPRAPDFELAIGESCHARPEWVAELREGTTFKITVRRIDEATYWWLDTEGRQGTLVMPDMRFDPNCWERY